MNEGAADWGGRAEDGELLAGVARYTGDIRLPGMAEAYFIRSPYAHAELVKIDGSAAVAAGAFAVITAKDLPFIDRTLITRYWHPAIRGGQPPLLAIDRVRYVGEAVAILIATDRYQAEDLAALVEVTYSELPVIAEPHQALLADAPQIHADWPSNIAAELDNSSGDPEGAFNHCAHWLKETFSFQRQAPLPLETRGCVADYRADGTLTVWSSTQVHFNVRNNIAEILDIPEDHVRVVAENVGGGFGSKSRPYAEEVLVSHCSRWFGRPVRWIEDRLENLQTTTHSRGTETDLEIGFDDDGRIHALRGTLIVDVGAYVFTSGIVTAMVASGQCAGPYRIENIDMKVQCVGTNRTPLATYRGAGQPEATFPIERMMDMIALKLGLSPLEVRLRNIVRPEDMPYRVSIPFAGPDAQFDSGDYPAILKQVEARTDIASPVEQLDTGEWTAWGMACGIEATGYITGESARAVLQDDGTVAVWSGMTSQGQGQRTTYAKVCADVIGIQWQDIDVHLGDTAYVSMGRGAFASRGAVIGANAVAGAANGLRDEIFQAAATLLQSMPDDLVCRDGKVINDVSGQSVSLKDVAGAFKAEQSDKSETVPLQSDYVFDAEDSLTFAFSAHAAKVALDPETGTVRILDYCVIHDSGRPLDQVIVDGQITGGVADGIGGALLSALRFNEEAQPLCGTLADYMTIGPAEMPSVQIFHCNIPATTNALGVRGVGEGGVLPAGPAIANALARIMLRFQHASSGPLVALPISPEALVGR